MLKSFGKSVLRKSVAWGVGEPLYRKITKSGPETVAARIRAIRSFAAQYQTPIFVETGTHLGDTTWGVRDSFKELYTIEIEPSFAAFARKRFKHEPRITVLEGDSAAALKKLVPTLTERSLFFLDAHFSGGISGKGDLNTPLRGEFSAIASSVIKDHIIMVDDASEYTGENDYPAQEEVFSQLKAINPKYTVYIKDNFIIATV